MGLRRSNPLLKAHTTCVHCEELFPSPPWKVAAASQRPLAPKPYWIVQAIIHSEQAVVDNNNNKMVCCYPSTPKKMAMTLACFFGGAAVMALGVHLSYAHVAPQQARTKARNEFVKDRLRKKYGKLASDP